MDEDANGSVVFACCCISLHFTGIAIDSRKSSGHRPVVHYLGMLFICRGVLLYRLSSISAGILTIRSVLFEASQFM